MTLGIMTLGIMTLGITTLGITTLGIMTLRMWLHHSAEASTYPGFKQMCFVYIKFFRNSKKLH